MVLGFGVFSHTGALPETRMVTPILSRARLVVSIWIVSSWDVPMPSRWVGVVVVVDQLDGIAIV